jgi:hypothetical protein
MAVAHRTTTGWPTMHFGLTTAALLFVIGHIAFVAIAAVLFAAG